MVLIVAAAVLVIQLPGKIIPGGEVSPMSQSERAAFAVHRAGAPSMFAAVRWRTSAPGRRSAMNHLGRQLEQVPGVHRTVPLGGASPAQASLLGIVTSGGL